ncbi:hypothetical protein BX666DRAFT_6822 [Dichotomocladium elegans]|nr:hypothetical protein BX666DRAFT_6822 [Dichotomocladium elegans]
MYNCHHHNHKESTGTVLPRKDDDDKRAGLITTLLSDQLERKAAIEDSIFIWRQHHLSRTSSKNKGRSSMPEVDFRWRWARVAFTNKTDGPVASGGTEYHAHPEATVDPIQPEHCFPRETGPCICILSIKQMHQLCQVIRSPPDMFPDRHFRFGARSRIQKEQGKEGELIMEKKQEVIPKSLRRSLSDLFSSGKTSGAPWISVLRSASGRISLACKEKERGGPTASLRRKSSFLMSRCRSFATNRLVSPSVLPPKGANPSDDGQLPIHLKYSIYKLSYTKLADTLRPLRQQLQRRMIMSNILRERILRLRLY